MPLTYVADFSVSELCMVSLVEHIFNTNAALSPSSTLTTTQSGIRSHVFDCE